MMKVKGREGDTLSLGQWDVLGRGMEMFGDERVVEEIIAKTCSPAAFVVGSILYVVFMLFLKAQMKNRKAMSLINIMRIYNVAQVMLNLNLILRFIRTSKMDLFGPHYIFLINNQFTTHMKLNVYIHYLSKYLDFLDTLFIVLRKKNSQMSFLHVYHHATIGVIWGYLLFTGYGNGTAGFGAFINSIVHFLMYGHYLVTSFGIRNPLKVFITRFQIIQFYFCLLHVPLALYLDKYIPARLCYIQMGYHITMVGLFTQFYAKTYNEKKTMKKES